MIARLLASTVVAIVAMFVTVLVVTIVDLYLTGHGYPSINQEIALAMSVSDVVLLAVTIAAWLGTWWAFGRKRS